MSPLADSALYSLSQQDAVLLREAIRSFVLAYVLFGGAILAVAGWVLFTWARS